jgi:coenzyme F420-reducing hydrogenase alpha subunit
MTVTRISNLELDVNHVTRVEGHGNIVVRIIGGVLEHCQFQIVEAPRYFEAMLRGRPFGEASHIASRICGICAVAHATTSLLAVEGSLGLEPDRQTVSLRKLNFLGEILDSHILHVYMLVAPDLLGVSSVVSLRKSDPGLVKQVLRMKKTAGDICATICGRHTHPIAMTTGGFTHLPSESDLLSLKDQLEEIRPFIFSTVVLFKGVGFPVFEREYE